MEVTDKLKDVISKQRLCLLDDAFSETSEILVYFSESCHVACGSPIQHISVPSSFSGKLETNWVIHKSSNYETHYKNIRTGVITPYRVRNSQDAYIEINKYFDYGGQSHTLLRNDSIGIAPTTRVTCSRCKKTLQSKNPRNISVRFTKGLDVSLSLTSIAKLNTLLNLYDWRIYKKDKKSYIQRIFNDTDMSNTTHIYYKNEETDIKWLRVNYLKLTRMEKGTMKPISVNKVPVINYIMEFKDLNHV